MKISKATMIGSAGEPLFVIKDNKIHKATMIGSAGEPLLVSEGELSLPELAAILSEIK